MSLIAAGAPAAQAATGKGPVVRVGKGQVRVPVASDLYGSWGNVSKTGEPDDFPFTAACPGWPVSEGRVGKRVSVKLPKGGRANASGKFAIVTDTDGTAVLVQRVLTSMPSSAPPSAVLSDIGDDGQGNPRFKLGGVEHTLTAKGPLKVNYKADGTPAPIKLDAVVEPAFYVYEHRYPGPTSWIVEHVAKCLD